MDTTHAPPRCTRCGVALSRLASVEAHQRTHLCASTRRIQELLRDGYVLQPEDGRVAFILTASIPAAARWEPTSLIAQDVYPAAHGPFAQRWWPSWAVELAGAVALAGLRKPQWYVAPLRTLGGASAELVEAALTTLRASGVVALDTLLCSPIAALNRGES